MSSPASLESFKRELNRLVAKFEKEFSAVTDPGHPEARLFDGEKEGELIV